MDSSANAFFKIVLLRPYPYLNFNQVLVKTVYIKSILKYTSLYKSNNQ